MIIQPIISRYGYTVTQVSRLLGMHENSLPVILSQSRETNSISVTTLRKIANVIGCHISEFFEDEPTTHNDEVITISPAEQKMIMPEQPEVEIPETSGHFVLDIEGAIKRCGTTSKAIAQKIGISEVAFSLMLGKCNPNYERLQEIAKALGIEVIELFVRESESSRNNKNLEQSSKRGRKPKTEKR